MGLFGLFGGIDEFAAAMAGVHRELVSAGGGDGAVRVLPMAMPDDELAAEDLAFYERIGIPVDVVPVKSREDALQHSNAEALAGSSLIFVHGGAVDWVVETLRETPVWGAVLAEVDRGGSLAGTSAGIMALGASVPSFNDDYTECTWKRGLEVFPRAVIGSHWNAEGFHWMIERYRSLPPEQTIFAVDESTVAVGDGVNWQVAGEGSVYVRVDGNDEAWRPAEQFKLDLGATR